jgi:hypothetical protein
MAAALPQSEAEFSAPTARDCYFLLSKGEPDVTALDVAHDFLQTQLQLARTMPVDLPHDPDALAAWIDARGTAIGQLYRDYLEQRQRGGPRRYFSNKAHALYFLKAVAPTKLVDGSWLYGLLPHWNNIDYRALIKTYLEELGDGVAEKNHVVLFRKLLAAHGCEHWEDQSEDHFVQGAIQLSLAYHADSMLPEIVGFNLGYEQLPLHLLITAFELNELGIDPYYFTLHVTVDNADSGHARKAAQAVFDLMPRTGDTAAFLARVRAGYQLNELGASTLSVIEEFDLEHELVTLLAAKSIAGKNMHSDYCRIGGRTVNQWLASPQQIPAFLDALVQGQWIQRGAAAEESRFWRLIHSQDAPMFGIFTLYEQQVLRDWIEQGPDSSGVHRTLTHRQQQMQMGALASRHTAPVKAWPQRGLLRHRFTGAAQNDDTTSELRRLEQSVAETGGVEEAMQLLEKLMSPALHHSAAGLMATRLYSKLLG